MRVRVCQKICDWMYATFGHPVPRRAVDLVDFLHDQLEARPLKTFPETVMSSWSFLVERGDVPENSRIAQSGMAKRAVATLKLTRGKDAKLTKKAPPIFM
eukprot:9415159-Karenia_brevis.AAC.1